jgi:hypothetical protein
MLYLDADKQEVDLTDNDILEVISDVGEVYRQPPVLWSPPDLDTNSLAFVVLEFDVQAILNTDFHLDGVVGVRWHSI